VYIYPTNYPEGRLGAPFHGVYKILDNYHEWLVDAYPQEQRALYLSIYPFIHYKTVSPREKDKFPVRVMRLKQTGDKCATCRDGDAIYARRSWCVAPISNKAAYTLITDLSLLKQMNPKRTEV
jgi:hypothetical protein